MKAVLVDENVSYACPVTNLYFCGDRFLLVTVREDDSLSRVFAGVNGFNVPASSRHFSPCVEVFLSDERGQVIDYDGDPANGLTPILSTDSRSFATMVTPVLRTHADALSALGYTVE